MTHKKLTVSISGCAKAEEFRRWVKSSFNLNSTKAQINSSTYKVMVYGEFDDATYKAILGKRKDCTIN